MAPVAMYASILLLVFATSVGQDLVEFTPVTDARSKRATCMDGTAAGYFYSAGFGDGANNWLITLEGGRLCHSVATCSEAGYYGSSHNIGKAKFGGILSSSPTSNPDFYNWNKVLMHSCDGGLFYGNSKQLNSTYKLEFKGTIIFNAIIGELLGKGLRHTNETMLTGNLSGGLAVMEHCDTYRDLLRHANNVKCLSDGGYFIPTVGHLYNNTIDRIFAETIEFQKLSFKWPTKCGEFSNISCIFPQFYADRIKTPLFILNSAFDRFQITQSLRPDDDDYAGWKYCTRNLRRCKPTHKKLITDFRNRFLNILADLGGKKTRGMYISSCYAATFMLDDNLWNSPTLRNKTAAKAVGDWYFGRSSVLSVDREHDWPLDCESLDHGAGSKLKLKLKNAAAYLLLVGLVMF